MKINLLGIIGFLACVLLCLLAGFIGSAATMPSIPTWYAALNKPVFNPPNWIFAPVWTTLYVLMGTSLFLILREWQKKDVKAAAVIFLFQLALNTLWSILFFGLHSIVGGLITIGLLWAAIALFMIVAYRISRWSAWLMLPYLLWVTFATVLNMMLLILNA